MAFVLGKEGWIQVPYTIGTIARMFLNEVDNPDSLTNLETKRAAVAETINNIEFEEDYKNE